MKDRNPFVYEFLTIYSQSDRSTGGTRGYDPKTYVETKLDRTLTPKIFDPTIKLVILTGNAGDGKTAFIQRVEDHALSEGAVFSRKTDNGCTFNLSGVAYETLYDGSQDFEGTKNDRLLASFFQELEGEKPPSGDFTKVIAINEGKLRDFILHKPQYRWLGKQIFKYLSDEDFKAHESLIFVNLNLRSVVDNITSDENESILDLLLDKFLDCENKAGFWEHCKQENCSYASRCYIKSNVDNFRDPVKGPEIRNRLKQLLLAVHFRKTRHITMRDLRSILSLILFNKSTCEQLQDDLDAGRPVMDRFYYNTAFNGQELDRIAQILGELDVASVSNPKLDNFIHFHDFESSETHDLFIKGESDFKTDVLHLRQLYSNRPEGTQDKDPDRHDNAKLYHASLRRKLYFEGDEEHLRSLGLPIWKDLLPYRQFDRFAEAIRSKSDSSNELRDELTLAISKSERIYNETVGTENLCLRSTSAKRTQTKAFYGFPATDFEVVVKDIGPHSIYLEHLPSSIYYRHIDRSAELEIPLDLFEVLCRIRDGYVPTASEIRTFFLNLEMFKRRITSKPPDRIILTEDDTNLFEIKRALSQHLVMTKLGG